MPAIDLRDVSAGYAGSDGLALRGVTLSADRELVALLGPNGSGKSTLMRVLMGLHRPASGVVASPGRDHGFGSLGVVFQTPALDDLLTARENLMLAGALHGLRRGAARARLDELAPRMDLTAVAAERCGRLSGGQRRRVDLARALMGRPTVLLLDEPTAGLDIDARFQFWRTIDAVRADEQVTVLAATHLGEEAERADRVVMMREGRLVADGTPARLRSPLGARVARVDLRPGGDNEGVRAVRAWLDCGGVEARWWAGGAVVADAGAGLVESCPVEHATVRLSAPTLEDAYLWHTARTPTNGGTP